MRYVLIADDGSFVHMFCGAKHYCITFVSDLAGATLLGEIRATEIMNMINNDSDEIKWWTDPQKIGRVASVKMTLDD